MWFVFLFLFLFFFFQAEDGIRDFCLSRGLGDVYKRQGVGPVEGFSPMGKIQAGKIEIKRENSNAPMQLWFSEKVMIDYEPKEI